MGLKEEPYVMTMMTTYGTTARVGKETERTIGPAGNRSKVKFNYPEVFGNHFMFRHMVDDHNARRHAPVSFEESWATKNWTHRVFAFLIAITEVNTALAMSFFYDKHDISQINFRKELAKELINNKYLVREQELGIRRARKRSNLVDHVLVTLPAFKKFKQGKMVPSAMQYGQYKCVGCPKRSRKYCQCSPGVFRCNECYATHKKQVDIFIAEDGQTSVFGTPRSG
jgi:Transposase IS4